MPTLAERALGRGSSRGPAAARPTQRRGRLTDVVDAAARRPTRRRGRRRPARRCRAPRRAAAGTRATGDEVARPAADAGPRTPAILAVAGAPRRRRRCGTASAGATRSSAPAASPSASAGERQRPGCSRSTSCPRIVRADDWAQLSRGPGPAGPGARRVPATTSTASGPSSPTASSRPGWSTPPRGCAASARSCPPAGRARPRLRHRPGARRRAAAGACSRTTCGCPPGSATPCRTGG